MIPHFNLNFDLDNRAPQIDFFFLKYERCEVPFIYTDDLKMYFLVF